MSHFFHHAVAGFFAQHVHYYTQTTPGASECSANILTGSDLSQSHKNGNLTALTVGVYLFCALSHLCPDENEGPPVYDGQCYLLKFKLSP